jgi:hypothetical protein
MNLLSKNIFQNVKKSGTKILHVHFDILFFIHKFSEEKNIFYVLYKKDKFMYEHITVHRTYFCLFY